MEPSIVFGDAPCPHCGTLLWFLRLESEIRLYEHEEAESLREKLIEEIAEEFEVDKTRILGDPTLKFLEAEEGWDSLDIVEKIMEIEERLDEGP